MTMQQTHTATASGVLTPALPFDFAQTLRFLDMFSPASGEHTVIEETLTKAVMVNREAVAFTIGRAESETLRYTLSAATMTEEIERAALDRVRFYLSLDDDLAPFYHIALDHDEAFAPIVRRLYGFHQVKFLTPFENAAWAVLTQRMPIPIARRVKNAIVERYGGGVTVNGRVYRAFPEPETLAAVPFDDLQALIKNERKTGYLGAVARAFAEVDEQWLRTGDYEAVRAWLLAIDGIGAWSSHFVLVRGLGRMEDMDFAERHLLAAAQRVYGADIISAELRDRLMRLYGPHIGYWAFYLRSSSESDMAGRGVGEW